MRARTLAAAAIAAIACGKAPAPPSDVVPRDGFLDHLPADAHVVIRLPPLREVESRRTEFAAFADALGLPADLHAGIGGRGVDPARAAGLALTPSGGWTLFLPSGDRAALAEALRAEVARGRAFREEGAWALLSQGAQPAALAGEPLPRGDLALRARHHPLLALFAHAGDTLELGVRCAGGGFLFEGVLKSGAGGATEEALAGAVEAAPGAAGLEFLPGYLAFRAETTLPPPVLAEFFAGRVAAHARLSEERDRTVLARLLREALSGADAAGPFAFGLDATGGSATFVCTGTLAAGPRSPILARLRSGERAAFGPLVLDERRRPESDRDSWIGLSAWLAQAEPLLDGLPRSLWSPLAALCDQDRGLPVLYAERENRFVCAVGPRADALAFETLRRLAAGGDRAGAAWALHELRRKDPARFVFGAVVNGKALAALPEEDRALLRSALGLPPGASAPTDLVFAGYRDESNLRLEGRVAY